MRQNQQAAAGLVVEFCLWPQPFLGWPVDSVRPGRAHHPTPTFPVLNQNHPTMTIPTPSRRVALLLLLVACALNLTRGHAQIAAQVPAAVAFPEAKILLLGIFPRGNPRLV